LANSYRRGERVQLVAADVAAEAANPSDGLAESWTEDETIRAELTQKRSPDDIPASEFGMYLDCAEETLEDPDEVWSLVFKDKDGRRLYHFIRSYSAKEYGKQIWYIIVARETDDDEQIEILDTFPTRDARLVDRYRKGHQEVGARETRVVASSRVVH